ncbi:MAG: beta-lactamase family protein [Fibrobacteres bacterium]|nr:beta-lactamase family protein [Fibrobacterota bacterium]
MFISQKTLRFLLLSLLFPVFSAAQPNFNDITTLLNDSLDKAFNGKVCVMVMHGDSLVYNQGLGGYDSNSTGGVASATKTFSGLLMLKLANLGLLNLDDSIGKFIPYATQKGKGAGTLRQNFSHTGGWSGTGGDEFLNSRTLTLEQSVDSIITYDSLIYTPGRAFKYTGVAMQVAGRCAEVAAKRNWNELFNDYIKTPLNLSKTAFSSTTNPRIAGGINSCAADLLKIARLIRANGRVGNTQVIDSIVMQELWKDQTNGVIQLGTPYPFSPVYNNPYNADTIRYGIGTWLDIYNPVQKYQEQISGAGAFGTEIWVNRCNNTCGALFTMSLYAKAEKTIFHMLDMVNAIYPNQCYTGSTSIDAGADETTSDNVNFSNSPNPFNPETKLSFVLNKETSYRLDIYNLKGMKIACFSGTAKKGTNQIKWSTENLPATLYLANLSTPISRYSRLLSLVR